MHFALLDSLLPALTWTFVHSLWQGMILAVLAGTVLLLTRYTTASRRYAFLLILFLVFLGSIVFTLFIHLNSGGANTGLDNISTTTLPVLLPLQTWLGKVAVFLNTHSSWLALTWFIVFLFKCSIMIKEMGQVKSLRTNAIQIGNENWSKRMQALAHELRIKKPVRLLQSCLVKVPVTVGHINPVILVPIGMLSNMPPAQVEAVLLHELAHIRRHDYLVNFVQRLAESILFFNPAVLWVSSLLRAEREACCDELAINHTGSKLNFVEALIYCKEASMCKASYVISFMGPRNLLLYRVNRILSNQNKKPSRFELAFFGLSLLLFVGWMTVAGGVNSLKHKARHDHSSLSQQVEISEVKPSITEAVAVENGLEGNRNPLLPPPAPANEVIREIDRAQKEKGALINTGGDRIEVNLAKPDAKLGFNRVDKDRVAEEGKGTKRILVNELENTE